MTQCGDHKKSDLQASTFKSGETWQQRPHADTIPCPALLSFYNNGLLRTDETGNVSTAHLGEVLATIGASIKIREALIKAADGSDKGEDGVDRQLDSFNLFALHGSNLDHTGSTGIRDPEVDPSKIHSALLKFSENGRMYAEHFAAAANRAQKIEPGVAGTSILTIEFAALLEVFGRLDEKNKRYLTVEDVKGLWIDGKFPENWEPRVADDIGVMDVTVAISKIAVSRLMNMLKQ